MVGDLLMSDIVGGFGVGLCCVWFDWQLEFECLVFEGVSMVWGDFIDWVVVVDLIVGG